MSASEAHDLAHVLPALTPRTKLDIVNLRSNVARTASERVARRYEADAVVASKRHVVYNGSGGPPLGTAAQRTKSRSGPITQLSSVRKYVASGGRRGLPGVGGAGFGKYTPTKYSARGASGPSPVAPRALVSPSQVQPPHVGMSLPTSDFAAGRAPVRSEDVLHLERQRQLGTEHARALAAAEVAAGEQAAMAHMDPGGGVGWEESGEDDSWRLMAGAAGSAGEEANGEGAEAAEAAITHAADASPDDTSSAIFQHAFHELYRRTPALLTELRRYGLFRRQVWAAHEAAEQERMRADKAIASNAAELDTLRDAYSRFQTARMKLVDEMRVAQVKAAEVTAKLEGMEQSYLASKAREEDATAKLRALEEMGLPLDALLAEPCGMPGLAELLSDHELLAKVTSEKTIATMKAEIAIAKEMKNKQKKVGSKEDKKKRAEKAMEKLMEDEAFVELLLDPVVQALLQNKELLLALATPGVISAILAMPSDVLAFLGDSKVVAMLKAPGFLEMVRVVTPDALNQLAASGVLACKELMTVLTDPHCAVALITAAKGGALTLNVLQALSKPGMAKLLGDEDAVKALTDPAVIAVLNNPVALAALTDPTVVGVLTNPEMVKVLSDPNIVDFLTDPDCVSVLTNPDAVTALTHPDTLKLLGNPIAVRAITGSAELLKNPDVLRLLNDQDIVAALKDDAVVKGLSDPSLRRVITGDEQESKRQMTLQSRSLALTCMTGELVKQAMKVTGMEETVGKTGPETISGANKWGGGSVVEGLRINMTAKTHADGAGASSASFRVPLKKERQIKGDLRWLLSDPHRRETVTEVAATRALADDEDHEVVLLKWASLHLKRSVSDGPLTMDHLANPRTLAHLVAVVTDGAGGAFPGDHNLEGMNFQQMVEKVLEDCTKHLELPGSLCNLLLPSMSQGDDELLPSLLSWMFAMQPQLPAAPLPKNRNSNLKQMISTVQEMCEDGKQGLSQEGLDGVMKVVHEEEESLREGQNSCLRFQRRTMQSIISRLSTGLSSALYGKQSDSAQLARERVLFTTLAPETIAALGLTKDEASDVARLLSMYFVELRGIYKYYSMGGFMNLTEFHKLAKDAKFQHPKSLTQAQLDIIFTRVNRGDDPDNTDPKMRDNELEPREYINLLLRVAAARFGVDLERRSRSPDGETKDRMSLPAAFERLVVEKMLPNAATADDQEVKSVIGDKKMNKILEVLEDDLRKVFDHYSRGVAAKTKESMNTMDLKEFTTMLQHINVMGGRLVRSDLDIILGSVQTDDDADEASFDEFIEMLLVVSMHLNPNPYIPITKRFMLFLKNQLFPGVAQRISGINVKQMERKYGVIAKKSVKQGSALGIESDSSDSEDEEEE